MKNGMKSKWYLKMVINTAFETAFSPIGTKQAYKAIIGFFAARGHKIKMADSSVDLYSLSKSIMIEHLILTCKEFVVAPRLSTRLRSKSITGVA